MQSIEQRVKDLRAVGNNCAQAVPAAVLGWPADCENDIMRAMRGGGSGLACGKLCGCLIGAATTFGLAVPGTTKQDYALVRQMNRECVAWFEECFGSTECTVLKSGVDGNPPISCDELILRTAQKTAEILAARQLGPSC